MTTFWLTFNDQENNQFLGVAIFDMDESDRKLSVPEIVQEAWKLGVNPGGAVAVQEVQRYLMSTKIS